MAIFKISLIILFPQHNSVTSMSKQVKMKTKKHRLREFENIYIEWELREQKLTLKSGLETPNLYILLTLK